MLWLIQICIFTYCVYLAYRIIKLQKYNPHVKIIHVSKVGDMLHKIDQLLPILIFDKDLQFEEMNTNNLEITHNSQIIPLSKYKNSKESIFIYKHTDPKIKYNHLDTTFFIDSNILIHPKKSFTVIQGKHKTSMQRNIHNYMFIDTLDGFSIIYLINPKYKESKEDYKKNGYKLILQPQTRLYIPTNWYYIQEINENVIQFHYDIDDIFTFVPNTIKKYINMI